MKRMEEDVANSETRRRRQVKNWPTPYHEDDPQGGQELKIQVNLGPGTAKPQL